MPWSYPVLDPVSQAYPKVQGRSPTCYSPVRHSSTPKGLSVRLACVKHAASVRPEPGSNSPNKNSPPHRQERIRIRKIRSQTKDTKTGIQKTSCPQTGKCGHNKKQQTKTTKHTIEFSNNTAVFRQPCHCTACDQGGQARPQVFRPRPLLMNEILRAVGQTPKCPAQEAKTSAGP